VLEHDAVLLAGLGVDVVVEQAGRARGDRAELHLALDLGPADVVSAHEDGDRLLGLGLRVLDLGLDDLEALDEAGVLGDLVVVTRRHRDVLDRAVVERLLDVEEADLLALVGRPAGDDLERPRTFWPPRRAGRPTGPRG
jgi:hypothetical protein